MKIDYSVPIPKPKIRNVKYPFRKLQVGDSFFIPVLGDYWVRWQVQKRVLSAGIMFNRRNQTTHKWTTRSRTQEEDREQGVRVWRIA